MKIPADLQQFNLVGPSKPARRRLVATGEGGEGSGKTDFFLRTYPKPALVIQLDLNDEGLREKHLGEDILFNDVIVPPLPLAYKNEERRLADMKIAASVRDLYVKSIEKDYFRSIMIDEGMALYTLARRAFLQSLDFGEAPETSYAPINTYMERFYKLAKQHRVNLYIPHRQVEERKEHVSKTTGKISSVRTGNMICGGWKSALYESQCHVLFTKDKNFKPDTCRECDEKKSKCRCEKFKRKNPADKFDLQIIKCTANTNVEGMILSGEDITLANLGQLVFPLSDESDWV